MIRSTASKVMWVGRATIFLVGLAVILALLFGVAATAFGNTGGQFILGKSNTADAMSRLVTDITDPLKAKQAALMVQQKSGGPALDLRVNSGETPMKVSQGSAKVTNLSADMLDGKDSSAFQPQATYMVSSNPVSALSGAGAFATCDQGDQVLAGGYELADPNDKVYSDGPHHEEFFDENGNSLGFRWGWQASAVAETQGSGITITVHALCADSPPTHQ